jgi:hypothetical protein
MIFQTKTLPDQFLSYNDSERIKRIQLHYNLIVVEESTADGNVICLIKCTNYEKLNYGTGNCISTRSVEFLKAETIGTSVAFGNNHVTSYYNIINTEITNIFVDMSTSLVGHSNEIIRHP